MPDKIFLEIILGEKKRRTEFIIWTEHTRKGTIDEHQRGEIVSTKLDSQTRTLLSKLAKEVRLRNLERESRRSSGILTLSDKEHIKRRRTGEVKDAQHAQETGEEVE
jgi:hypothetical protein